MGKKFPASGRVALTFEEPAAYRRRYARELCEGALFIPCEEPPAPGTAVVLTFQVASLPLVSLPAEAARLEEGARSGVHLRFDREGNGAQSLRRLDEACAGLIHERTMTPQATVGIPAEALPPSARVRGFGAGDVLDGRFRIERHLAEGGMGDVFLATHIYMKRPVALKLLSASLAADPEMSARFQREAELVSQIESPHVVKVFDFGRTTGGLLFLAMEFVEGLALDEVLDREGAMAPERAVPLLAAICEALAEAHDRGMVHRDLKPPNIMVGRGKDGGDFPKVLDFGIARLAEAGEGSARRGVTREGMVLGTPEYVSPEQALAGDLDARTDVYSLGVVAFETLTGRLPFVTESLTKLVAMHLSQRPPHPSEVLPSLARWPRLCEAVLKALSKERDHRFQDMRAFSAALTAALEAGPLEIAEVQDGLRRTPEALAGLFASLSPWLETEQAVQLVDRRQHLPVGSVAAAVIVLELGGAREAPGDVSSRVLGRLALAARDYGAVVEELDATGAILLLPGEDPQRLGERAARLCCALREAVVDERRGLEAGAPLAVKLAAAYGLVETKLRGATGGAALQEARALLERLPQGAARVDAILGAALGGRLEIREPKEGQGIELVAPRASTAVAARRFVGRAAEQETLRELLSGVSLGAPATLVTGEEGAGKTRLAGELVDLASRMGLLVTLSSAAERQVPFGALTSHLCALCGLAPERRGDELKAALSGLGLAPGDLGAALVVASLQPAPPLFSPGEALSALLGVAGAVAGGRSLLLVFDDVDRSDAASLAVFELLGRLSIPGVVTVGFSRSGELQVQALPLPLFGTEELAEICAERIGAAPTGALLEWIAAASGGNPRIAIDLACGLQERGFLHHEGEHAELHGAPPELDLEELAVARVDASGAAGRRLLEAAALLEDSFDPAVVEGALGAPGSGPAWVRLERGGLLDPDGGGRARFAADRYRRAALRWASPLPLALLHQRLAAALVEVGRASAFPPSPAQVAAHLSAAGDHLAALGFWQRAVELSMARRDFREAALRMKGQAQATALAIAAGAAPASAPSQQVKLLARASAWALVARDPEVARAAVDEGAAIEGADPTAHAELALAMARVFRTQQQPEEARAALASIPALSESPAIATLAAVERAEQAERAGDLPGARAAFEEALRELKSALPLAPFHAEIDLRARLENRLANLLLQLGEPRLALAGFTRALEGWRRVQHPSAEARLLSTLGELAVRSGKVKDAANFLASAADAAARCGDLLFQAQQLIALSRVLAQAGESGAARERAEEASQLAMRIGWEEGVQRLTEET